MGQRRLCRSRVGSHSRGLRKRGSALHLRRAGCALGAVKGRISRFCGKVAQASRLRPLKQKKKKNLSPRSPSTQRKAKEDLPQRHGVHGEGKGKAKFLDFLQRNSARGFFQVGRFRRNRQRPAGSASQPYLRREKRFLAEARRARRRRREKYLAKSAKTAK